MPLDAGGMRVSGSSDSVRAMHFSRCSAVRAVMSASDRPPLGEVALWQETHVFVTGVSAEVCALKVGDPCRPLSTLATMRS